MEASISLKKEGSSSLASKAAFRTAGMEKYAKQGSLGDNELVLNVPKAACTEVDILWVSGEGSVREEGGRRAG